MACRRAVLIFAYCIHPPVGIRHFRWLFKIHQHLSGNHVSGSTGNLTTLTSRRMRVRHHGRNLLMRPSRLAPRDTAQGKLASDGSMR